MKRVVAQHVKLPGTAAAAAAARSEPERSEPDRASYRSPSFTAAHEAPFGDCAGIPTAYDAGAVEAVCECDGRVVESANDDEEKAVWELDCRPRAQESERAVAGAVRALGPGVIVSGGRLLSAREKLKLGGQVMAATLGIFCST
jgi:hypothetical protein